MTQLKTQELNAYFLPKGFVIDDMPNQPVDTLKLWVMAFKADIYSALFHLGFLKKEEWFSPSIEYPHNIAEMLIKKLSQQSEIEFNRDATQVDLLEDELYHLKEGLPFVIGMEYVDNDWIGVIWEELLAVFKLEIINYDGTVARWRILDLVPVWQMTWDLVKRFR